MRATARRFRMIWLCCITGLAGTAHAVEFVAEAEVLSVEPIVRYQTVVRRAGHCVARPNYQAGLVALLAWDLAAGECSEREQREITEGYRVTYEWDGRRYHQTMPEPPGATLPVAVRVQ